ncbi:MAG: Rsd/AlgQ family anti-sigma factor [Gammaproteobacteria bacterium]
MTAPPEKPDRRQRVNQLINQLQKERGEVWSLYCQLADMKPFGSVEAVSPKLIEFSQLLVDYVSLGHFGIYDRLLARTERRNRVLTLAKALYPRFSASTDAAVSFNDKYENFHVNHGFDELEKDLSDLGEWMAKRVDLEDKLCELMRQ